MYKFKILIVFVTVPFVVYCFFWGHSSQVNTMQRLWARHSRIRGLIPGRGKINSSLPPMMAAQSPAYKVTRSISLVAKRPAHESDYWPQILPKLRMIGGGGCTSPLSPVFSWRAQRQVFLSFVALSFVFIFCFMLDSRFLVSIRVYVTFQNTHKPTAGILIIYVKHFRRTEIRMCQRNHRNQIRSLLLWEKEKPRNWRLWYWSPLTIRRRFRWRIGLRIGVGAKTEPGVTL